MGERDWSIMTCHCPTNRVSNRNLRCRGSILLYVLWILVVISVLAFKLSAASRVTTLNQSAFASHLKDQMQLQSAIQFAKFKITMNQWEHQSFNFDLNNQTVQVRIFNESGFVSIYQPGSDTLIGIFERAGVEPEVASMLGEVFASEEQYFRFNSYSELLQFEGINRAKVQRLIPLVSIFHEDLVNPRYSPAELLAQIHGVDNFRAQKLIEAVDDEEKDELRQVLSDSLFQRGTEVTDSHSIYYRVSILIDGQLHRVFLRVNGREESYQVVLVESNRVGKSAKAY
jgi:type II secretory pathway component PulK